MRLSHVAVATLTLLAATTLSAQVKRAERSGGWIGLGVGAGVVGADCDQCGDDVGWGFGGHVRAGGTITRNLLLGFETNGWLGSPEEGDSRLGFAALTATLFPSVDNGFYLKIGLGGMSFWRAQVGGDITAVAPAVHFGIGYEVPVTPILNIVPYVNYLGSTGVDVKVNGQAVPTSTISVFLIQLGVGVMWP